jgi:hypothetical protein
VAKISGAGWMTAGSSVLGAAVTLFAGFWIYSLTTAGIQLWSWPTWAALAGAVVGSAMLVHGMTSDGATGGVRMKQTGGRNSTNIQSGRDSIVYRTEREER